MSDLQLVLIVIGSLIIAAVLTFNWWQERKFHRQIEQNFSEYQSEDSDIGAIEPAINDEAFILPAEASELHLNTSQDLEDTAQALIDSPALAEHDGVVAEADNISDDEIPTLEVVATPELQSAISSPETLSDTEANLSEESDQSIDETVIQPESIPVDGDLKSSAQAESTLLPAMLNSQVDCAAILHLSKPLSISAVLSALNGGFSDYDKPVHLHVFCQNTWQLLSDMFSHTELTDAMTEKICCSIQMADRAGAITRSMLNRFQHAVESLGTELDAQVVWQSTSDAAADAQALDAFCIEVDKTMGFHLLHGDGGAFTGTKLRGLAEAQGMTLAGDGAFKYYESNDESSVHAANEIPIFIMFNRDHHPFTADMLRSSVIKSITFQLDIPHVKNAVEAFNLMLQAARQMEISLHAQLVDDNNRALNDAQIVKIRQYLQTIQAAMLKKGIPPGSDVAHRLFS